MQGHIIPSENETKGRVERERTKKKMAAYFPPSMTSADLTQGQSPQLGFHTIKSQRIHWNFISSTLSLSVFSLH